MEQKYKDIRSTLLRRITDGHWPQGSIIPNEADLAEEFACTRATISRALRGLSERGLIERKKKAGTRVVQRGGRDATVTIDITRDAVERNGARYSYTLLSRAKLKPPPAIRAALELPNQKTALNLVALHLSDGRPHQLEERWINLETVPEAAKVDFNEVGANEWLVNKIPFTDARHVLRAERPGEAALNWLDLKQDEWVFVIERTTWLSDASVTHVRLSHPADSFQLATRT